ncbi:class I SAM-dependent methyltransferase [Clostridium sp. E02]|uniref:class I SAM-dependent methyltransferase n=1 Tax=Clostridium sp. E02 TaxID=2487134 RepID=UPI000F5345F5|nr:class I SAM-dependent methyltransferase [Clostridium sp. E02]
MERYNEYDVINHNKKAWNIDSKKNHQWTVPVEKRNIDSARIGSWDVVLTTKKAVPHNWFPGFKNLNVLGLACGGGQQIPIFSALGANVTLLDNSDIQIQKDIIVAKENNLDIKTIEGDMSNLQCFSDESFDLVFNPVSTIYVPEISMVFKEVYRVLKPGGRFLAGFVNPIRFIFDSLSMHDKKLIIKYKIPFNAFEQLDNRVLNKIIKLNYKICYGHSLNEIIGKQLKTGFTMVDFYEDSGDTLLDEYILTEFATYCKK